MASLVEVIQRFALGHAYRAMVQAVSRRLKLSKMFWTGGDKERAREQCGKAAALRESLQHPEILADNISISILHYRMEAASAEERQV